MVDNTWKRVPWGMQNYIFFYLRSHHFPVTPHNVDVLSQAIADRLDAGPVEHRDLEVLIEQRVVGSQLDEGSNDP